MSRIILMTSLLVYTSVLIMKLIHHPLTHKPNVTPTLVPTITPIPSSILDTDAGDLTVINLAELPSYTRQFIHPKAVNITGNNDTYSYLINTSESIVMKWYEDTLQRAGMTITYDEHQLIGSHPDTRVVVEINDQPITSNTLIKLIIHGPQATL